MKTTYLLITFLLLAKWVGADDNQRKHILPEAPATGRFTIKDREWPDRPGEASICLWKDDALAAASITIDDNWAPDHPWWLEMGQKYGLHFTWFVISGYVNGRNGFYGTWERFQKLLQAGHDIQSHTVFHLNTADPGWKNIESEYADSVKQIEAGLPGHHVVALAYPGGKNTSLNDTNVAAKYYIGCRGTAGQMNPANKIDYIQISSVGGVINLGNAQFESQDLLCALEKGKAKNPSFYRAWYCCHFHGVKDEDRASVEKSLAMVSLKTKAGDLWPGLFVDVVRYGQERDTARLEVRQVSVEKITLAVTDEMDKELFDYPLTVKVRLAPARTTVKATQAAKVVACRLIEHAGAKFVLVDVIPDRGEVVVSQ